MLNGWFCPNICRWSMKVIGMPGYNKLIRRIEAADSIGKSCTLLRMHMRLNTGRIDEQRMPRYDRTEEYDDQGGNEQSGATVSLVAHRIPGL